MGNVGRTVSNVIGSIFSDARRLLFTILFCVVGVNINLSYAFVCMLCAFVVNMSGINRQPS